MFLGYVFCVLSLMSCFCSQGETGVECHFNNAVPFLAVFALLNISFVFIFFGTSIQCIILECTTL